MAGLHRPGGGGHRGFRQGRGDRCGDAVALARLAAVEWDLASARTGYLTHNLHPYPAKFIPQIPNALIWLGHDPEPFKKSEIGSHRKYSAKGRDRAVPETFRKEFESIFQWLRGRLRDGRYACFVIGDSTIDGKRVDNASLLAEAGAGAGFREAARIGRTIAPTRKAFNPRMGGIRTENVLILRKA